MSETIPPAYEVTEEVREESPTITIRVTTTMNSISEDIGRIYGQIYSYLEHAGAQPAGVPFARYHEMSEHEIDLEAGVPVEESMPGNDQVKPSTLPGGPVAVVWYTGPYGEGMGLAYEAISQWIDANSYEPVAGPWEVYWTDPNETAPEDYRTEIVWPIRKSS